MAILNDPFADVNHESADKILAKIAKAIDKQPLDDSIIAILSALQTIGEGCALSTFLVKHGIARLLINLNAKEQNHERN